MPRHHTGKGTLIVAGKEAGSVDFQIAEEQVRGWRLVRGTLSGDPAVLAEAMRDGQAELRHDATGFMMHVTILDVTDAGVAQVAVDVSDS